MIASSSLQRRVIQESDIDDVVTLLAAGFPARSATCWRRGLERLRSRYSPPGYPRYGRLLESEGRIVGVLLTIYAEVTDASGEVFVRCNVSSWYVEGAFAGHAPLLLGTALRDKRVTTINITPAPHTEVIAEALGFRPFAEGSLLTVPLLGRREHATVRTYAAADGRGWPDARLIADHAALGCPCFVLQTATGLHPFVFSPSRRLRGFLPASQLLYCRKISDYIRFAGALGIPLLRHHIVAVLVDGIERMPGVASRTFNLSQKKYVVGSHPPRPGDLAYTELAFFA